MRSSPFAVFFNGVHFNSVCTKAKSDSCLQLRLYLKYSSSTNNPKAPFPLISVAEGAKSRKHL